MALSAAVISVAAMPVSTSTRRSRARTGSRASIAASAPRRASFGELDEEEEDGPALSASPRGGPAEAESPPAKLRSQSFSRKAWALFEAAAGSRYEADDPGGLLLQNRALLPTFVDPHTEREYRSWEVQQSRPKQRILMPIVYVFFVASAVVCAVGMSIWGGTRSGTRAISVLYVIVGHAPGTLLGAALLYVLFRHPSFYRRHMTVLLAVTALLTFGSLFLSSLDYAKPQVLFFPIMWAADVLCRAALRLPVRAYGGVLVASMALVWIGYPLLGLANSFEDFQGFAILGLFVLPLSVFAAREVDCRQRRDFARSRVLASELERVRHESEGLQARLKAVQREQAERNQADLDPPLAKAVQALKSLASDPRLGDWAVSILEGTISGLLASGSMMVPNLRRQLRRGTLRLDSDVTRWLFTEVAPSQADHDGGSSDGRRPSNGEGVAPRSAAPFLRPSPVLGPLPAPRLPPLGPVLHDPVEAEARRILPHLDSWEEFDVFAVDRFSGGRPLLAVAKAAVCGSGLADRLELDVAKFSAFVSAVEEGYRANSYHNRTHAADVTQAMWHLMEAGGLGAHLSDVDRLAAILACVVHDFEHPAVTNSFLVATEDALAVIYNDRSPLESHHVAAAWRALRSPAHDFLAQALPRSSVRDLRRILIELVLATDMSQHFEILGNFRKRAAASFGPPPAEPAAGPAPPSAQRSSPGPSPAPGPQTGGAAFVRLPPPTTPSIHVQLYPATSGGDQRRGRLRAGSRCRTEGFLRVPGSVLGGASRESSREPSPARSEGLPRRDPSPDLSRTPSPAKTGPLSLRSTGPEARGPLPENLAPEDRRLLLCVAIKACDVSHVARSLPLHIEWTRRVMDEFFSQGDRERELELPISPFMDRATTQVSKSQVGFMDFVCLPLLTSLAVVLPDTANTILQYARRNHEYWKAELRPEGPPSQASAQSTASRA